MADIRVASSGKKAAAKKAAAKPRPSTVTPITPKATTARKAAGDLPQVDTQSSVTPEERRRMIAEAAYLRAERRGFVGGDPNDDWLSAEAEIDNILSRT